MSKRFEKGKLYPLNLSDVTIDSSQPRKFFDETALQELKSSIEKHGVLQPVLVRRGEDGHLVLVSGERRYQASLLAGLTTIPAIITDGDPAEIAIVENLLRENLTAIEEAEAIAQLKDSHNYQLSDLSQVLGKSESTLSEILSLTRLPDDIKDECRANPKISKSTLLLVSKQATEGQMRKLYRSVTSSGLGYGEVRDKARIRKGNPDENFDFVKSFTKRIEKVQATTLERSQGESLAADLELLRGVLRRKIKALRLQVQQG